MRATVTGGAGFIGHHLVAGLLARGHEVQVVDDFSSGTRARLAPYADRIRLTTGSVLDPAALDDAVAGSEVVFHEAAIASVMRSVAEPRLVDEVNVGGTIEVLLAASRHGVRRVVVAGSSAVYGSPDALPCRETHPPAPTSPYGASKAAAEAYAHAIGGLHGVETVVLRYFNVYGPGQDPASEYAAVVPRFISALLEGVRPTVNGNEGITRDFVHVDDVVAANLLAAAAPNASGLTCNIASGSPTSLRRLLRAVADAVGCEVEPVIGPARPGDIAHSHADVSLARRALGWEAGIALDVGIARTVDAYRAGGPERGVTARTGGDR